MTRYRKLQATAMLLSLSCTLILAAQSPRLGSLGTIRDIDYDRASGSFVVGGDHGVYFWMPDSGGDPTRLTSHQVTGLAISPGGDQLVYGDPAESFWVTLSDNKQVRPFDFEAYQGVDFDFSEDGETLLAVDWSPIDFETLVPTIHILRTSDGSVIRKYEDIDAFSVIPWAAKLSPDGRFLAVYSKEGGIRVYDNRNGEIVVDDNVSRAFAWDLIKFSKNGEHVAFREQEGVRIYSTKTWERNTILPPTWGNVFDLSDEGGLLVTGYGLVLPITGGPALFNLREQGDPNPLLRHVRISPSGKLLLVMAAIVNRLQVWDLTKGQLVMEQDAGELFEDRKFFGDFLPDESGVVFSTSTATFRVARFDGEPGPESEMIVSLRDITHLQFDPTDTYLQLIDSDHGSNGKPTVRSLDIESDIFSTIHAPTLYDRAAFSPNGRWFAIVHVNGQGPFQIWDQGEAEPLVSQRVSFTGFVDAFAVADDGQTGAVGLDGGRVIIWSDPSRQRTKTLSNRSFVRGLTFAPDSKILAAMTSDGWVYVLNSDTREILWEKKFKSDFQFHLVPEFSPDGSWLAVNGEDRSQVWEWETDSLVFSTSTRNTTRSFAFSGDQRFLAIGAYSDVDVFQISNRRRLVRFTLSGFTEGVNSVAFSHDLQTLAAGTGNGDLRLWSLDGRLPAASLPELRLIPQDLNSIRLEWIASPFQSLLLESSSDLSNWHPIVVTEPGNVLIGTEVATAQFFRLTPTR